MSEETLSDFLSLLERCNEAIINAFKHYWLIEQDLIEQGLHLKEDSRITKLSVAICLSYFK